MKSGWLMTGTLLVCASGFTAAISMVNGSATNAVSELPRPSSTPPPAQNPRFGSRGSFDRAAQKSSPLAWDLFIVREGHDPLAVVARAIRGYPTGHRLSVNALPPRDAQSHTWDWMSDPGPLTHPLSAPIWEAFDLAAAANTVESWDRFLTAYPSDALLTAPAKVARSRARSARK